MRALKNINSIQEYKKNKRKTKILVLSFQLFIITSFLLCWEFFTKWGIINSFFLSSPSQIFNLFINYIKEGELFIHVYKTTLEALLGLVISLIGGILIATLLYLSPFFTKVFDPFLVLLNALPKSALAPLLIIVLGTSVKGIVGVAVSFVLIITIINVLNHFKNVDENLIVMMKSMSASKFQILTKVVFPSNILNIISIVKVAIGLSWVGVIVGEFLSSKNGLGYLIMYGGQVFKLDLVMMGITILSLIAFMMYGIVLIIEKLLYKKYAWKK